MAHRASGKHDASVRSSVAFPSLFPGRRKMFELRLTIPIQILAVKCVGRATPGGRVVGLFYQRDQDRGFPDESEAARRHRR